MIIPLIFSLDPANQNKPFLWSFYKGLFFARKYSWPIVAQERYFAYIDKQKEDYPYFFQKDVCSQFEYACPQAEDLSEITKVMLPDKLEKKYIEKFPSQTDAYLASLLMDWHEMEEFLEKSLCELEVRYEEKVEAILMLQDCKFVNNVCEKLKIPVFHYEWGPMRYSVYRNTAYFDQQGLGGDSSLGQRYATFKAAGYLKEVPIFSNRELLAIFLNLKYLHYAEEIYPKAIYKMGLAFGYTNATLVSARTSVNQVELYTRARNYYLEDEIGIRYHPGDPMHAKLLKAHEESGNLIDFILKCERVACINSNVAFEAMLFGKYVYEEKWSQYGFISNYLVDGLTDRYPENEILNFVVFGLLIPYELLNSAEYIRFRLKVKDEKEIYLYHLNYYLSILGLDDSFLNLPERKRLKVILMKRRGKMEDGELKLEDYIRFSSNEKYKGEVNNYIDIKQKEEEISQKIAYIDELTRKSREEYAELVKTNELLKKEQEYSQSLLEGIEYRDGRINQLLKESNEMQVRLNQQEIDFEKKEEIIKCQLEEIQEKDKIIKIQLEDIQKKENLINDQQKEMESMEKYSIILQLRKSLKRSN